LQVVAHRKLAIFRRRVFTALSVLSLLLCVATLALWYQSYDNYYRLLHRRIERETVHAYWAESHAGCVTFFVNRWQPQPDLIGESGWVYHRNSYPAKQAYDHLVRRSIFGFGFTDYVGTTPQGFSLPHWFLALLFAILPALHLRALIRSRRRHRTGHCPRCGYDLRATPERCPGAQPVIRRRNKSSGGARSHRAAQYFIWRRKRSSGGAESSVRAQSVR
jgi:hypothetical protein